MKNKITGITRVRNESLILKDTLTHFFRFCEHIVIYDDASTDNTVEIAESFDNVTIIHGHFHDPINETNQRKLCHERVQTQWTLCFDADERIVGEMPDLEASAYRFKLLDGYMTKDLRMPYFGGDLAELPRLWGPERRDILMLFRTGMFRFEGMIQREPHGFGIIETPEIYVKHFGKCLSIEQWEEACDFYAKWPEPYASKWIARKGKAIHELSDFGEPLYSWEDAIKNQIKNIH